MPYNLYSSWNLPLNKHHLTLPLCTYLLGPNYRQWVKSQKKKKKTKPMKKTNFYPQGVINLLQEPISQVWPAACFFVTCEQTTVVTFFNEMVENTIKRIHICIWICVYINISWHMKIIWNSNLNIHKDLLEHSHTHYWFMCCLCSHNTTSRAKWIIAA